MMKRGGTTEQQQTGTRIGKRAHFVIAPPHSTGIPRQDTGGEQLDLLPAQPVARGWTRRSFSAIMATI
jgi:hypothetical protein